MKILIIGGGGREHALAWKVAQSPRVEKVYVAPGNAGTETEPKVENVPIAAEDLPALRSFAASRAIDLTLVGPEGPLVMGIVDQFRALGLRCFGPTGAAAQLEGSKAFCKEFLARHGIPTAAYRVFTEPDPAVEYIRSRGAPIVVKADGLAAGKGVVVAGTVEEAVSAARAMLTGSAFGAAGRRVVVEDFLAGEEASFMVIAAGEQVLAMASAQDHKARDEGDRGPNTGGLGAYSPAPVVTPALNARIMAEIIRPTLHGLAAEGRPYTGFLYAGLMIGEDGVPRVLEYNCRLGDPETQPVLLRLKSDLVDLCLAALDGQLATADIEWDARAALGVVLAAGGYPGSYATGDRIHGLPERPDPEVKVFHAGTRRRGDSVVTAGGRVLCVCALGATVAEAAAKAYAQAGRIHWNNIYYRKDIGYRALGRA
ncbi:phosphoribosylamine--glycine ligase [Candidatus Methylocalor cossyra]|uniref:Phosphoribosylamine--glycine ligase n=1 Tax=Candidatus Methylocalor cossyra TaxID=3108543 RepID=A0ABP1C579_9GAMM